MLILALAAVALLPMQISAPQDAQIATQRPAEGAAVQASPTPQPTPPRQSTLTRAQARQICSRRPPTGSRLDQTTCVTREIAAAQARAGQDELDKITIQTGWQIERGD